MRLRRDLRRDRARTAAEDATPDTTASADQPVTDAVIEAVALAAAATVATVQAVDATTAASAEPDADQVTPADEAPASSADETSAAPRAKKKPRRRPRTASGPRRAGAPTAPAAVRVVDAVSRRRAAGRKSRTVGAVLAIVTLVGGTALPALGMATAGGASAAATSVLADGASQSLTVKTEALPHVEVRGDFSATTPAELVQIQAAAAATARSGVSPIAKPGQVIIPMAEGTYTMTDGFGASRPGRSHMGQDYAAPIGTPIYAAADGVVTMSQDSYGGYGVTVQVKHDQLGSNSVSTLYGHMDYGTRAVNVGEHVVAGQFLGRVGNTGYTIGSCLHFEVRISGSPIDPVPWLKTNVR